LFENSIVCFVHLNASYQIILLVNNHWLSASDDR
jgi:hypothetical protein